MSAILVWTTISLESPSMLFRSISFSRCWLTELCLVASRSLYKVLRDPQPLFTVCYLSQSPPPPSGCPANYITCIYLRSRVFPYLITRNNNQTILKAFFDSPTTKIKELKKSQYCATYLFFKLIYLKLQLRYNLI